MYGSSCRDRALQAQRLEPRHRRRTRRGRVLADLVAIEHEDVGAGARELARDGEAGEAGAADEHVGALAVERLLGPPLTTRTAAGRRPARGAGSLCRGRRTRCARSGRGRPYTAAGQRDAGGRRRNGHDERGVVLGEEHASPPHLRRDRAPAAPSRLPDRVPDPQLLALVGGQVDPVEPIVLAHVAEEVRQLERDSQPRHALGLRRARRSSPP